MIELTPEKIATYQTDLLEFSKIMFLDRTKTDFIENWHHRVICETLEKVVLGRIKRLIINLPPRYSKTELAVINFMAWSLGIFPDSEFIHASYSKRLATQNSWRTRSIAESELYQRIFNTPLRQDSKARDEWRTRAGGIVYATGSEGTITGYGAGKMRDNFGGAIIIDDPHKAGETASDVKRQAVLDWFNNTMESRTNSPNTPIIVIMQRLHVEDLTGFLLEGGSGEEWTHLVIPALDEQDTPLWPYKHDLDRLKVMQKTNPYVFASQYLQTPNPLGGSIFKSDWWKFWDNLPFLEYRFITADTALKTKEYNDWSVFQCWGYEHTGKLYLIDQIRGKWEAPQLLQMFERFWEKHRQDDGTQGTLRAAYIEDKASGTGLIQSAAQQGIPVIGTPRNIDKITRAMDVAPVVQTGLVFLPRHELFTTIFLNEAEQFSPAMTHRHDDQVDAMIDAIKIAKGQGVAQASVIDMEFH